MTARRLRTSPANRRPIVMISSTVLDLPEHREKVRDACSRLGLEPCISEYLPATSHNPVGESLKLVDRSDIYVGIFGYRYGCVPHGHKRSITEMEYDRACERGIPRLIFLMSERHHLTIDQVERGPSARKVDKLRGKLEAERVVKFFDSMEQLPGEVLLSLDRLRREEASTASEGKSKAVGTDLCAFPQLPRPPEPYVAHPYTLLLERQLIGREGELKTITEWAKNPHSRILSVVAAGGMGKSALTWQWFHDISPKAGAHARGRIWWSFYESDADFDTFLTHALAYVRRQPVAKVKQLARHDRERNLLAELQRSSYVVVLDGFERLLVGHGATAVLHDRILDKRYVGSNPQQSRRSLRHCADPTVGRFLVKLLGAEASRIVISSRISVADLEDPSGRPQPGCRLLDLGGLDSRAAVKLWLAQGADESPQLGSFFATFGGHPLLIRVLAQVVSRYRPSPGNFDAWRKAHRNFKPFAPGGADIEEELRQAQTKVLEVAFRGLGPAESHTLSTIAGLRAPAGYKTLNALLVRGEKADSSGQFPYDTSGQLNLGLAELEDRGLLGWDRPNNRYDLHPIVRSAAWGGLSPSTQKAICARLADYFGAMPKLEWRKVECAQDLAPAVELFVALVRQKRFDDAFAVFDERLHHPLRWKINDNRLTAELLEYLLDGHQHARPSQHDAYRVMEWLAHTYNQMGRSKDAVRLMKYHNHLMERNRKLATHELSCANSQLSVFCRFAGDLRSAAEAAQLAVNGQEECSSDDQGVNWYRLGAVETLLGDCSLALDHFAASERALTRRFRDRGRTNTAKQASGSENRDRPKEYSLLSTFAYKAQLLICMGEHAEALSIARRALAIVEKFPRPFEVARANRVLGASLAASGQRREARDHLEKALRATRSPMPEEELPIQIQLAKVTMAEDPERAIEYLDRAVDEADGGRYPIFHTDALNVLAETLKGQGRIQDALTAARRALRTALRTAGGGDIRFAYHWGIIRAQEQIAALRGTDAPASARKPQTPKRRVRTTEGY